MEHRLIHKHGEVAQNCPPLQPEGSKDRTYAKDQRLTHYAKVSKENFIERVSKLEQKLKEMDEKAKKEKKDGVSQDAKDYAQRMKTYAEGDFKNWIEKYERLELNSADQLEKGLAMAEQIATELEGRVYVEENRGKMSDLPDGQLLRERYIKDSGDTLLKNGYAEVGFVGGKYFIEVPRDWMLSSQSLLNISTDPNKVEYKQDISGGRKRIFFAGGAGTKFEVTKTNGDVLKTSIVEGSDKKLRLDLSEFGKKTAIEKFEEPLRIKKEKGLKTAPQMSPEKAQNVVDFIEEQIRVVNEDKSLSPEQKSNRLKDLQSQLDTYKEEVDQKRLQTVVRALREGREEDAKSLIKQIEDSFKGIYGKFIMPFEVFKEVNKQQLERTDQPYIFRVNSSGTNENPILKLRYEKNSDFTEKQEKVTAEKNSKLAVTKLLDAFEIQPESVTRQSVGNIAKNMINLLKQPSAGKNYGLYLDPQGNLMEWDTTLIGTNEAVYTGFEKAILEDPVKVLRNLSGYKVDTLEDEKTKGAMNRTKDARSAFENERDRLPDEIEKALTQIKSKMDSIRTKMQGGAYKTAEEIKNEQAKNQAPMEEARSSKNTMKAKPKQQPERMTPPENVERDLAEVNQLLQLEVKGIRSGIVRVKSALGNLDTPIKSLDGTKQYIFSYDEKTRKVSVKTLIIGPSAGNGIVGNRNVA